MPVGSVTSGGKEKLSGLGTGMAKASSALEHACACSLCACPAGCSPRLALARRLLLFTSGLMLLLCSVTCSAWGCGEAVRSWVDACPTGAVSEMGEELLRAWAGHAAWLEGAAGAEKPGSERWRSAGSTLHWAQRSPAARSLRISRAELQSSSGDPQVWGWHAAPRKVGMMKVSLRHVMLNMGPAEIAWPLVKGL